MRISVHENDQAFNPAAFGAIVIVDGLKVEMCTVADEERGEVLHLIIDETGDRLVETSKRGKVVIHWPRAV